MGNVVNRYVKVTGGRYEWALEYKGHIKKGSGGEGDDRMRAAITGLGEMLSRMVRPSVINIKLNEMNVANYINNGWLGRWKENNWQNSHGVGIKHADLWQQVRFADHAIRAEYVRHLEMPGGNNG